MRPQQVGQGLARLHSTRINVSPRTISPRKTKSFPSFVFHNVHCVLCTLRCLCNGSRRFGFSATHRPENQRDAPNLNAQASPNTSFFTHAFPHSESSCSVHNSGKKTRF